MNTSRLMFCTAATNQSSRDQLRWDTFADAAAWLVRDGYAVKCSEIPGVWNVLRNGVRVGSLEAARGETTRDVTCDAGDDVWIGRVSYRPGGVVVLHGLSGADAATRAAVESALAGMERAEAGTTVTVGDVSVRID